MHTSTINILQKAETYGRHDENGEGIPPHAPKPYKASIWTHILKEEVVCQWNHNRIAIDRACSHVHIADVKAPRGTVIHMFLHKERGQISKRGKHKNQCCWDPYKPISIQQKRLTIRIRYPFICTIYCFWARVLKIWLCFEKCLL